MLYQRFKSVRLGIWLALAFLVLICINLLRSPELHSAYVPALNYLERFEAFLSTFPNFKLLLTITVQLLSMTVAYLAFKRTILEKIEARLYVLSLLVVMLSTSLWVHNFWYCLAFLFFCLAIFQLNVFSRGLNSGLRIFNAGMFIAIATILLPSAVVLLFTAVLAMMAYNDLSFRNILLLLFGFATPIYFLSSILFLNDSFFEIGYLFQTFPISAELEDLSNQLIANISLVIYGTVLLLSVAFTLFSLGTVNVQSRRTLNFYSFNVVYFIVLFALIRTTSALPILFIFPFGSLFLAHALSLGRRSYFLIDILFTLLIASIFIQYSF